MKESLQSAIIAGSIAFSPSIGYTETNSPSLIPETTNTHQIQEEHGRNGSFELDDLSRELKIAVTLAGIAVVAGKYANTKRFTMHSETDQDYAAWTSFAAISAATAMVVFDTWNSSLNFLDFL